MVGKILASLAFTTFLLLPSAEVESKPIYEEHLDNVYLQVVQEPHGVTVASTDVSPGVKKTTNGTFYTTKAGVLYPIGRVISLGKELPILPVRKDRLGLYRK